MNAQTLALAGAILLVLSACSKPQETADSDGGSGGSASTATSGAGGGVGGSGGGSTGSGGAIGSGGSGGSGGAGGAIGSGGAGGAIGSGGAGGAIGSGGAGGAIGSGGSGGATGSSGDPGMACVFEIDGQQFGVLDATQSNAYSTYLKTVGRLNGEVWADLAVYWPEIATGTVDVGYGTEYAAQLYVNNSGTPANTPHTWTADEYGLPACKGTITTTSVQGNAVSGSLDITFCGDNNQQTDHVTCTFSNIPQY